MEKGESFHFAAVVTEERAKTLVAVVAADGNAVITISTPNAASTSIAMGMQLLSSHSHYRDVWRAATAEPLLLASYYYAYVESRLQLRLTVRVAHYYCLHIQTLARSDN